MQSSDRRQVLRLAGLGLVGAIAGCVQSQPDGGADETASQTATATVTETPTDTETATATDAETATGSGTASSTTVEVVASFPVQANGGTTQRRRTVIRSADVAGASAEQGGPGSRTFVSVELTESGAETFTTVMQESGFTSEAGIDACRYDDQPEDPGYCLHTVVDGEIVSSASMAPGLADNIEAGDFQDNPAFRLTTVNMSQAERIAESLSQ